MPAATETAARHEILPAELHVEILDPQGLPCPPGVRGEITLTGGVNPYLPLLRYRTGDFAALDLAGPRPALLGFEGRPPTIFFAANGRRVPSIDVTMALAELPLPAFTLHQAADGGLEFCGRGDQATLAAVELGLRELFGEMRLTVAPLAEAAAWEGKQRQFTSVLRNAEP